MDYCSGASALPLGVTEWNQAARDMVPVLQEEEAVSSPSRMASGQANHQNIPRQCVSPPLS